MRLHGLEPELDASCLSSNLCRVTHRHAKVWSGNTRLQEGGEGEGGDRGTGC